MQKLFKVDEGRAGGAADKENMRQSRVETVEVVQGRATEPHTETKSFVPDTPAKEDKEFGDFESDAKGKTDAKSRADDRAD